MNRRRVRLALILATIATSAPGVSARAQAPKFEKPQAYKLDAEDRRDLEERTAELEKAVAQLPRAEGSHRDAMADVAVYAKAGTWALRYGEFYNQKDVAMTLDVLKRGLERAKAAADGRRPWAEARGSSIRGYESKVDGSYQPYAVIVPEDVDPANDRLRLDVVLHGRGETLNEARFIANHDGKPALADASGKITLHVFGRTNNAYRWAGEADVFEAIDTIKRNFKIDERRVVLRGFSMGGAGAWHLGLHYPSLWSSVEAGAGFSETKNYARLEKRPEYRPEYQDQALHIYDAVDYAGNAFNVPMAGYGGEEDPQRQASLNIEEALVQLGYEMKAEGLITRGVGLDFLRVVGAKMGHRVDPESAKILKAFHDERAVKGANLNPQRIRFVTYTLKYNQAPWLAVEAMQDHYRRAYVDAEIVDKTVVVRAIENVAVLSVFRQMGETIKIGGREFPLEAAVKGLLPDVYFRLVGDDWQPMDYNESRAFEENDEGGKRHNVQGPIDDAFGASFLCVVGTGNAWNPQVQEWAKARLQTFADDWRQYLRGEIRVKKDTEVTPDDFEKHHLVLFGDPGSNVILSRLLKKDLPLVWTDKEIQIGGQSYASRDHVPVLIAANPLNPLRYVVLNTGHTFGTPEFRGTNALLFPHLGDYAVFEVGSTNGVPKVSGYFDEKWKSK